MRLRRLTERLTLTGAAIVLALAALGGLWLARADAISNVRDCSANSVIKCGALSIAELKQKYQQNQGGNVQALFKQFGMNGTGSFDGMVPGHVDTANHVYTDNNGKTVLVGKDALTAGRQNISGSTAILNGQFYQRPPSVSIASASGTLDAFVKLDSNGKFLYAVMTSCGNPVKATPVVQPKPKPQPQPEFTIQKSVRAVDSDGSADGSYSDDVTIEPGQKVQFRITVVNTGGTDFSSVNIKDSLPSGLSIVPGTTNTYGGGSISKQSSVTTTSSSSTSGDITQGVNGGSLSKGQSMTITFQAVAGQGSATKSECTGQGLVDTATATPHGLQPKSDTATVHICTPPEKPKPAPHKHAPPATPVSTTPQALPNTGAGSGALYGGLFIATSAAGAFWHRLYLRRKLAD